MNNLVSVVVTSYNHAEYLEQRMESLLGQTYQNLEIIVVDDCSTDDSMSVLENYRKYSHITIIALENNSGYANACNLGVSLSSGEFIMFAECDDYSDLRQVETLLRKLIENESAGVVYSRSTIIDSRGAIIGDDFQCRESAFRRMCARDTLISGKEIQKFLLISCVVPNMSAALIRKSEFIGVGGVSSKFKACADWDLWCRLAERCDFYYVNAPLNNFRTHATTVRNTFAITVQLSEIFDLLHRASGKTMLTVVERFRFKINLGRIWGNYIIASPINGIRCFRGIWRESLRYDSLSGLYLLLGFAAMLGRMMLKMFK